MKKWKCIILAVLLSLGLPLAAGAAELSPCTVSVETISARSGETVTVAVSLEDNPGFHNLAIGLDYDPEKLTLKSIQTQGDAGPYLCGTRVAVNLRWEHSDGRRLGYVVAACGELVKENGVLFTATFEVVPGFTGETEITPVVSYIRNNESLLSVFREVPSSAMPGLIRVTLEGDVNGDGMVEYNDVMLAYKAFLGQVQLTPSQMAAVDRNGNGTVEESEYQAIYGIYIGG